MQTYRITAPHFVAALITGGDTVLQSAPILGWAVGQPFVNVRDYCHKRGWVIEPLAAIVRPSWLEVDGIAYEITWHEGSITKITKHESGEDPQELTYNEIPEILREQL